MVESSPHFVLVDPPTNLSLFLEKLYIIECAIEGAHFLAKEALLDESLKADIQNKLAETLAEVNGSGR